ncbi:hypothetical protein [Bacillus sp. ISL-4]|uniref:hypothetical protein n=1 Tax=Bacillus sp. ISL-4 TaxID=2819125 RepID=UPI001BE6BE42|nr:hypothetical protein [Bacillus sp. ISL-4]
MFPFLFRAKGRGNRGDLKRKTSRDHLRIKESEVYRGEVFLHDISPYLIDEELKVEVLLVILFMDFLKRIKEKGYSSQAMKAILLKFEDYLISGQKLEQKE